MTAIYGSTLGNTVQLVTDGAVTDFDGVLLSTETKVRISNVIPLAVTGRGQVEILDVIKNCVVTHSTIYGFDATLAWLQETLRGMRETIEGRGRLGQLDIVVAGLSGSQGLGLWLIFTHDLYADTPPFNFAPYTITKVPEFAFGPPPSAQAVDRASGWESDPENLFRRHGANLLESARSALATDWHSDDLKVSIGGHADLTVVGTDSVTTERLVTWPDVVGEKMRVAA